MRQHTFLRWMFWSFFVLAASFIVTQAFSKRVEIASLAAQWLGTSDVVYFGDSITRRADLWDARLGLEPLTSENRGEGGAVIQRIEELARRRLAKEHLPSTIVVMAGSNDAYRAAMEQRADAESADAAAASYSRLLDRLRSSDVKRIIVVSTPPQADARASLFVQRMNHRLREEVAGDPRMRYLDLWPDLSDGKRIRPEMTTDGLHFTEAAYAKWVERLLPLLKEEPAGLSLGSRLPAL